MLFSALFAAMISSAAVHATEVKLQQIVFQEPESDLDFLFPADGADLVSDWVGAVEGALAADPSFPEGETVILDVTLTANQRPRLHVRGEQTVAGHPWSWAAPDTLPDLRILGAVLPMSLVVSATGAPPVELEPVPWLDRLPPDAGIAALDAAIVARVRDYVLPFTALCASQVDPKFEGVRRSGALLNEMSATGVYAPSRLYADAGYWRGVMEMSPGNPLVEAAPVLAGLADGKLEASWRMLSLLVRASIKDNAVSRHLFELKQAYDRMESLRAARIQAGIALEDRGDHEGAVAVYDAVLVESPCSAWAMYERGFSLRSLGRLESPAAIAEIHQAMYACDPLYPLGLGATGADEIKLLSARLATRGLFNSSSRFAADLVTFGDSAQVIGQPGLSATAWWMAMRLPDPSRPREELLGDFLLAATEAGARDLPALLEKGDELVAAAKARRDRPSDAGRRSKRKR